MRQTRRIDQQSDHRRFVFQLERDRFRRDFGADIFDELFDEVRVIGARQDNGGGRAAREFEQFVDHVAKPVNLFADAVFAGLAHFRRGVFHRRHFRRDADDVERVLEVVNDGPGEAADEREAFRLEDLLGVLMIEIAHAQAELLHQTDRQTRRARQNPEQIVAQDEINLGVRLGRGRRGARLVVQHRHFAEEITRREPGKDAPLVLAHQAGDLDLPLDDDVESVTRIAFLKDIAPGLIGLDLGGLLQRLQFGGEHATEQFAGLQDNHRGGYVTKKAGSVKHRDEWKGKSPGFSGSANFPYPGASGRTRTCNLLIRSQKLYPIELPTRARHSNSATPQRQVHC